MDDKVATQIFACPIDLAPTPPPSGVSTRYLILLKGGTPGAMVPIGADPLSIGRSDENALVLPESSVSRLHAELRIDHDGQAWITDRGSTNGTYRNGRRLTPREPSRLGDGDRIRIGTSVVLKYACPDPEEAAFQRSMYERTVRDPLTGLYNRAYFLDQLGWLSARATARGLGVGVVMLDIDRFKSINDSLGHQGGDLILRQVAGLIRLATRAEDLVSRFGGEEFAIAIPIGSEEDAMARAERIRATLARRRIAYENHRLKVTASLGVAFAERALNLPVDAMIASADRALYRAKEAGRNRVARARDNRLDTPLTIAINDA